MELAAIIIYLVTSLNYCRGNLWCYECTLKDHCTEFSTRNARLWKQCEPGTTHCIKEKTVSVVTGATVVNRMCGGEVYIGKNTPLADGCYMPQPQPSSRINATKCYCSSDYCNEATTPYSVLASILAPLIPILYYNVYL